MDKSKLTWPSDGHVLVQVYEFVVSGSFDDPDIVAAEPMSHWLNTEAGKWANSHAITSLQWYRSFNHNTYGYIYKVTAVFSKSDYVFWKLKYE